jgi:hypothetical protein
MYYFYLIGIMYFEIVKLYFSFILYMKRRKNQIKFSFINELVFSLI